MCARRLVLIDVENFTEDLSTPPPRPAGADE